MTQKTYLEKYWKDPKDWNSSAKSELTFHLKEHHKFWSTFQQPTRKHHEISVLEYAGGPTVANLISAARNASRIVFAEYTESNRNAVKSWLDDEPDAHDWSSLIGYVATQLEGDISNDAVALRTEELRNKIKSVVSCDITARPIVDVHELFDVISTSFSIEQCSSSLEEYEEAIKQLSQYLKPGGFLHMAGSLEESLYVVGEQSFYVLPLTRKIVEGALENAGMLVMNFEVKEMDTKPNLSDRKGLFTVNARKTD